jgi:hypothetical protein
MKLNLFAVAALSCAIATPALAQKPVPVTSEPHHHIVYKSDRLRVFRVEVPAHSTTLIHEHAVDYFWIAVGPSEFVNAAVGKPEATVVATDGSVHFTRGGFSHLARVDGEAPFRNVTLELPLTQTHPRNLCETILPDEKTDCPAAMRTAAMTYSGGATFPAFETDQVRVTRLTAGPDEAVEIVKSDKPPTIVIVDDIDGTVHMVCGKTADAPAVTLHAHSGDTFPGKAGEHCILHNAGKSPVRFLAVEFR